MAVRHFGTSILIIAALAVGSSAAFAQVTPSAPAPVAQSTAGGSVENATVEATNGRVLVNRAAAYQPATKGLRLAPGDRLVVLEGGTVGVRYDGGCLQSIATTTVYTVNAAKNCEPSASDRGLRQPNPVAGSTGARVAGAETYVKWGLIGLGVAAPIYIIANNVQGSPISP